MGKFKVIESRDAKFLFQNNLKKHKKKLQSIKPSIDNAPPSYHFSRRGQPATPRVNQDKMEQIAHNNLKLANKIFDIMEGPGLISDILKQSEAEAALHPGTLNFQRRVKDATRIHNQNISLAMRLDNVRPFYGKLFNINKERARTAGNGSPSKSPNKQKVNAHGVPGLALPRNLHGDGGFDTTRTEGGGVTKKKLNMNYGASHKLKSVSARGESTGGTKKNSLQSDGSSSARKNNVLLEYSKIQNGRVLDIAVIKEPFQDRYAVFGIDIDNGQRYEVRLTSDDVSSILDGDILVTSLDNVEVWMALLNKVSLKPVENFSKLATPSGVSSAPSQAPITSTSPFPVDDEIIENLPIDEMQIGDRDGGAGAVASGPGGAGGELEPEAPSIARPTTRPGGRGSRSQARQQTQENREPSTDIYEPEENLSPVQGQDGGVSESDAAAKIQSIYRGNKARAEKTVGDKPDDAAASSPAKQVTYSEPKNVSPAPPKDPKSKNSSRPTPKKGKK